MECRPRRTEVLRQRNGPLTPVPGMDNETSPTEPEIPWTLPTTVSWARVMFPQEGMGGGRPHKNLEVPVGTPLKRFLYWRPGPAGTVP